MADNDIRVLKVSQVWRYNDCAPMVRLKGKWLAKLGINPGDRVVVRVNGEGLTINRFPL